MKIHILILAAGNSSRLGQTKQLLMHKGSSLLNRTIEECVKSKIGDITVVLGAKHESIKQQIIADNMNVVFNPNWQNGMGASLAFGLQSIDTKKLDGLLIVLTDQIYFESKVLKQILIKQKETNAPIVISRYQDGAGPPSFFESSLFDEISQLNGDQGAKSIVQKYKDEVAYVDFHLGDIDVDVPADLSRIVMKT